jgi:membrane-bound metal-dependent hydrolase YbcI (DUF457 family)
VFVGHYGVGFALKRRDEALPLSLLFVAVQLLDVAWAPFVLLGIEKARIVPGITRSNPLDLYYMPFTHSLVAALLWSVGAAWLFRLVVRRSTLVSAFLIGLAVFSHWILDFVVHRPDLPLYDDSAKVGLGLWNVPAAAFGLEAFLLLGGLYLCARANLVRPVPATVFALFMLGTQAYVFFGPPPTSPSAAAVTAFLAYGVFAIVIHCIERRPSTQRVG